MTIFRSERRRCVLYTELRTFSFAPVNPDSINISIGTDSEEGLVELECLSNGLKTIFVQDSPNDRVEVQLTSSTLASWSEGLQRKAAEMLVELSEWETKLRGTASLWDLRLLADPNLSPDVLIEQGREKQ